MKTAIKLSDVGGIDPYLVMSCVVGRTVPLADFLRRNPLKQMFLSISRLDSIISIMLEYVRDQNQEHG